MDNLIALYKKRLDFPDAIFLRIDHEDAMVAIVYKVIKPNGESFILKICERVNDYLREIYYLKYFADKLPVPKIAQVIEPEIGVHGAVLMECLPGEILTTANLTDKLLFEMGSLLARIHLNRLTHYGDLIQPDDFSIDPRIHFTFKFEEGLDECKDHLPKALIEKCRLYYERYLSLFDSVDGPCVVHRDFRPGNIMVFKDRVSGIIDWSSGRVGFAEEDFCSMEHGESLLDITGKSNFLSGYASIRSVPNYNAMVSFLRLNKAIATIGFTVKRGTWKTTSASLYQYNRKFLETFIKNDF